MTRDERQLRKNISLVRRAIGKSAEVLSAFEEIAKLAIERLISKERARSYRAKWREENRDHVNSYMRRLRRRTSGEATKAEGPRGRRRAKTGK